MLRGSAPLVGVMCPEKVEETKEVCNVICVHELKKNKNKN
jgi:hypothetical protein